MVRRPRSVSHAQAVVGFRRLSSGSPQNPPRRLDVGLTGARGEGVGELLHAVPAGFPRSFGVLGRHGIPGQDVEQLVGEIEVTAAGEFTPGDQDGVQLRKTTGRPGQMSRSASTMRTRGSSRQAPTNWTRALIVDGDAFFEEWDAELDELETTSQQRTG